MRFSLRLNLVNRQRVYPVMTWLRQDRRLRRAVRLAVRAERDRLQTGRAEVTIALVDDPAIAALNERFRRHAGPTDVLSFPLRELLEPEANPGTGPTAPREYLGDVIISVPRAVAQAETYGHSVVRELAYLATHGCLHLLGYDHETPAQRAAMRAREEAALAACGLTR